MLIATFNVNSVRTRLDIITRWLSAKQPDLLFLQETKTQDAFFPDLAFSELGYNSFFHGEKTYNGVALLIKNSINDFTVSYGFDNSTYQTRLQLFRHKDITILNTYVPQGKELTSPSYTEKKEFLSRVREIITREISGKFLWLGDLNVAPEPIDVTHPETKKYHVCFCSEIRELFAQTKSGLVDILRKFNNSPEVFTFYDYRVKDALARKIGWRIDHMLASPALADLAVNCSPDTQPREWDRPSDHVPLTAEFNINL